MDNTKLKQLILKVLKKDDRLWNEDKTELNQTLLLDLVEKIDETVIDLLLQEKDLREKFFKKLLVDSSKFLVEDEKIQNSKLNTQNYVYVFKTNDFRFFMEENKVDNSYTAYKNRIGLTDGKKFLKDTNDVVLDFPYKDCVLEGGQSSEEGTDTYVEFLVDKKNDSKLKTKNYELKTAKRKEIFFNSVLAHDEIDRLFDAKALTNWKRYSQQGSMLPCSNIRRDEDGTIKENMIIKGNNLLALHSLKKQFAGKVKLIYIDPPYNTGNDGFKYNDNFNHSTWLTFMKNRLEVARELLRDDGVIFVQCDDNEQAYLKVLMDDIFKKDNFISSIVWQRSYSPINLKKHFSDNHDTIHCYTKKIEQLHNFTITRDELAASRYKNPDNDPRGVWQSDNLSVGPAVEKNIYPIKTPQGNEVLPPNGRSWVFSKEKLEELLSNNRIYFPENGNSVPRYKRFLSDVKDGVVPMSLWTHQEVGHTQDAKRELKNLFGGEAVFESPKPEKIMQRIIEMSTEKGDIVLDYHLGSGTTCAVAHKIGRQYIGIEQMDYIEDIACERMKKVIDSEQGGISKSVNWQGGGDFIYFELAKWNETAKEKILACESLDELEKFFDEMYEIYFLNYNLKIKEFKEKVLQEENFRKLSLDEQKKIFVAMLDNNQMYVNKTEMADKKFGISEEEQDLTSQFYNSQK